MRGIVAIIVVLLTLVYAQFPQPGPTEHFPTGNCTNDSMDTCRATSRHCVACQPDGSYSPLQRTAGFSFCVEPISGTEILKTKAYGGVNCTCEAMSAVKNQQGIQAYCNLTVTSTISATISPTVTVNVSRSTSIATQPPIASPSNPANQFSSSVLINASATLLVTSTVALLMA